MRNQLGFNSPTPTVTSLLIVIIATFLLFSGLGHSQLGARAYRLLFLDPQAVIDNGQLWRMFSYAFLHDRSSPLHVIFNCLLLYMIGPQLEEHLGEKRFLLLVIGAIFLGAILVCLSYLIGLSSSVVLGFSAAGIALLIAWGLIWPQQQMYVFGILPLSGRQMVYATIALEVLYAVSSNNISSAAHFGGILAAFIFSFAWYKPAKIKQLWRQACLRRRLRK